MPRSRTSPELSCHDLLERAGWHPLPHVVLVTGSAQFFKRKVIERFAQELFGESPREVRRYRGSPGPESRDELPLHVVLDELRTPSFFSVHRLVVIERADAFLKAHQKELEPFIESGFAGGHLILDLSGSADKRTRFAKSLAQHGWIVDCRQPFDRPPPWKDRSPVWDSELSHWLSHHARTKGLALDPRVAFALHDRLGTDLERLDEELEKLRTYLAAAGQTAVRLETIEEVTGDLREDTIFHAADVFLEGRRRDAVGAIERLFSRGCRSESGAVVIDAPSIALPLLSTILARLRALRRAHALAAEGSGSEEWIRQGLVRPPFLARFERQLGATPPGRIRELAGRLYEVDRAIKLGGDARHLVFLLVAE